MARHRTQEEKRELGERARELRAAGRSRREIKAELRIGDDLATQLLVGTEVPGTLRRPRARDDVREQARELRRQGETYDEIAAQLHVSKGSLSLWLRDLPGPDRSRHGGDAAHVAAMAEARWGPYRRQRDAEAQQRKLEAALMVGVLDERCLLLLGAVAYWCEGAKSKPWRRQGKWTFINSDPLLIRLMVQWLRLVGVPPERWVVRIQIHETADVDAAEEYWRHILGLPELVFGKASIKRHKPLTTRKNVGTDYHGCLCIYVRRGAELLQQVEGWIVGALLGAGAPLPDRPMQGERVRD